jgi:hypothetical protein
LLYLFDIINICQGEDLSQFILQVINGHLQMLPICFQNRFEKKIMYMQHLTWVYFIPAASILHNP